MYLATGNDDNKVKLWNVKSQNEAGILRGHSDGITSIKFSPDGKFLASGSYDKLIKLWSMESLKEVSTLQGHRF
jgi:WD40 repeat protein